MKSQIKYKQTSAKTAQTNPRCTHLKVFSSPVFSSRRAMTAASSALLSFTDDPELSRRSMAPCSHCRPLNPAKPCVRRARPRSLSCRTSTRAARTRCVSAQQNHIIYYIIPYVLYIIECSRPAPAQRTAAGAHDDANLLEGRKQAAHRQA